MKRFLIIVLFLIGWSLPAAAQISVQDIEWNPTERDTLANSIQMNFEVVWPETEPTGEEAAWIFGKFERAAGVWGDIRFDAPLSRVAVSVIPVTLPAGYAHGLLVHRPRGSNRAQVEATWTLEASFFDMPDSGVDVLMWGVDMVKVPEGAFAVGGAEGSSMTYQAFRAGGTDDEPFTIASEAAIEVGDATGQLAYSVAEGEAYIGGDMGGPIPDLFPKGYEAFWVMKYPLTQGQYAAFLSAIGPRARSSRDITTNAGYQEQGGSINCGENCSATFPDRAANFLSWADAIGWASWAGLRPMTEFEYEKAAAGTPFLESRYADGELPESVYDSARVSDLGVVDMRGGLWERVVSVGTPQGRAFRGSPGQGFVDDLGYPYGFTNPDWPGPRALGSGYRGGTEGLQGLSERTNRTYGAYEATYGNNSQGFRAVLSAPND